LTHGDRLRLIRAPEPEADLPAVACTLPAVFDDVHPGERVWFDDGRFGGLIEATDARGATVRIDYVEGGRSSLDSDRGINFPDSTLHVSGLTAKDCEDLEFVARSADVVALSFAQRSEDVAHLYERLTALGAANVGVVLKIESRLGFDALPELLAQAMGPRPLGVMIARGDLAMEVGYERMAEVQEEILWVCEAAHVPVIWATQVLERLAKEGMPTRAEVTDAAAAVRAECVMLNKGKHMPEAIGTLDDILRRMQAHQHKKSPALRPLHISHALQHTAAS
jgi:pyruvate kinase